MRGPLLPHMQSHLHCFQLNSLIPAVFTHRQKTTLHFQHKNTSYTWEVIEPNSSLPISRLIYSHSFRFSSNTTIFHSFKALGTSQIFHIHFKDYWPHLDAPILGIRPKPSACWCWATCSLCCLWGLCCSVPFSITMLSTPAIHTKSIFNCDTLVCFCSV